MSTKIRLLNTYINKSVCNTFLVMVIGRVGLKPSGPTAPVGPALELSPLYCSTTHNTLQVLQRTAIITIFNGARTS